MHIEFDTENAAFEDVDETARILRDIAGKVEQGFTSGPIIDSNGNTVGSWTA